MRTARLALVAMVLLAVTASAQQGVPGAPPAQRLAQANALKDYLQLTDQQVSDLKAVQASLHEAVKPLLAQLAQKAKALREERKKDSPDQATIKALLKEVQDLRQQIQAKRDEFGTKSRNVLTADQLKALSALQQALMLVPAARQAVALNLIEAPEGLGPMLRPGGAGGGRLGPGPIGGLGAARRAIRN